MIDSRIDSSHRDDSQAEVEALLRGAQDWVQVSDELRPRVLETARLQRHERRVRRHVELLAAFALLAASIAGVFPPIGTRPPGAARQRYWEPAGRKFLHAQSVLARPGDVNWNLVDLFTECRQRHASALRPAAAEPGERPVY